MCWRGDVAPTAHGWAGLLEGILAEGLDVNTPGLEAKAAAQLLRDAMQRRDFVRAIKRLCTGTGGLRQQIIAGLPLAAVLTTNFDLLTAFAPSA